MLARNKERISFSLFLLVLIISISTHLFIHLTTQKKEKQKLYKISIGTLWTNIKTRRFVYIEREENIWPQVLGDRIFPPFFQHYEKNIAYRILRLLFTAYALVNLICVHIITKWPNMTVVPCTKVLKDFPSVWSYKIFEYYRKWFRIVRHNEFYLFNY